MDEKRRGKVMHYFNAFMEFLSTARGTVLIGACLGAFLAHMAHMAGNNQGMKRVLDAWIESDMRNVEAAQDACAEEPAP